MRKFLTLAFCLSLSGSALAETPAAKCDFTAKPAEFTIKLATVAPPNTPWSELLKRYEANIATKTNCRIDVKVFLGGTQGDENESVLKCKRGQIQAVGASTGALGSQVPELSLIELPFLFNTEKEADSVIDAVITPKMEPIFRKYGLVLGFWSVNGFRQFGINGPPIKSPADLVGKKMRSQEFDVHLDMWRALGASPVPVATTEVLGALNANTVDGFDQAALFTLAAGWYEKIKSFTVSNHIYQPAVIAYNAEFFDKLPADLQAVLIAEGRGLQQKGRDAVEKIGPDILKIIASKGVAVYTLTEAERQVFKDKTLDVRAKLRARLGAETSALLDEVEAKLQVMRGK